MYMPENIPCVDTATFFVWSFGTVVSNCFSRNIVLLGQGLRSEGYGVVRSDVGDWAGWSHPPLPVVRRI